MTKLKLTDLADDKPVRLTIELPATIHRDLASYAAILGGASSKSAIVPEKLIAPMIARFMATDRAFAKARRGIQAKVAG
ncbi:MAG: DUF2274 domain-containing protein [Sphingomonadaceae bacterium]